MNWSKFEIICCHLIPNINPTQYNFTVQFEIDKTDNVTIEIVDAIGKILYNKSAQFITGTNTVTIDASSFARGNYYIKMKNKKGTFVQKVVLR